MVMMQSSNWNCKTHVRAHLDSVRTVWWYGDLLVSGSDDGLIKIWEKDQAKNVIREHLGPIYSICGNSEYCFTAGAEGVIRKWRNQDLVQGKGPID